MKPRGTNNTGPIAPSSKRIRVLDHGPEVTAMLKRHAAAKEPAVLLRADLAAGRLNMAEYAQQVPPAAAHTPV